MKRNVIVVCLVFALASTVSTFGQERAELNPPLVREVADSVTITTRFVHLGTDLKYRIGVGLAGDMAPNVTVKLVYDDGSEVGVSATEFEQQFTEEWFSVPKITATGFVLQGSDLAENAAECVLSVVMSKATADQIKKLFVFVARDYGSGVWYLEDGVEVTDRLW